MSTALASCGSPRLAGRVTSASTSTGAAREAGRPEDEVPTTWNLSWPGCARGTTTEVWKSPFACATTAPTTTSLGSSKTIFTEVPGLNPCPLSGNTSPAFARLGADTSGVATMPGGDWRVVGGVPWWRSGTVVGDRREVDVDDGGSVVEVVELVDAVGTVETVEVVGLVEEVDVVEVVERVREVELDLSGTVEVVDVLAVPEVLEMSAVTGVVAVSGMAGVVEDVVVAKLLETVGVREVVGTLEAVEVVVETGKVLEVVDVTGAREVSGVEVVDEVDEVDEVDDGADVVDGVEGGTVAIEVLGALEGNAPGGDTGTVVVVVLELEELTGIVVGGTPVPVVDEAAVLGGSGTPVVPVVLVVVVLDVGAVVVVVVVLVDGVATGALVVVVTGESPVVAVVVLVVPAVVVVTDRGKVGSVVLAEAPGAGEIAIVTPSANRKRAPRDSATSRANRLLELWEDNGIQAPGVGPVGTMSWPPTG